MEYFLLFREGLKKHIFSLSGIFLLVFFLSVILSGLITISVNSRKYIETETKRLGIGDMTLWVSAHQDSYRGMYSTRITLDNLSGVIGQQDYITSLTSEDIIYAEYHGNGHKSDSEGQFIKYNSQNFAYKVFDNSLKNYSEKSDPILPGEILISPAMVSLLDLHPGDTLSVTIARNGIEKDFTVKGYFEDPYTGSSMIGLKSFIISLEDYAQITEMITQASIDGLARTGKMFHITWKPEFSSAEINRLLNENTPLPEFLEFSHSTMVLIGFMLTFQNVFAGLFAAFGLVLFLVSLVVLSFNIGFGIMQDQRNFASLKVVGASSGQLQLLQILQYSTAIFPGILLGIICACPLSFLLQQSLVTTLGILIPTHLPLFYCILVNLATAALLILFVWFKSGKIKKITILNAISENKIKHKGINFIPLRKQNLSVGLALRQLLTGKPQYSGVFLIAAFLCFFCTLTGRISSWLGSEGEGLMDAFNPADLHIAAQPMGETTFLQIEEFISQFSPIQDKYFLAMPTVSLNGLDYTANVITEPERFHILQGNTCTEPGQIVITEFIAADLNLSIGDKVSLKGDITQKEFTVSGIYQCANDLGANIGMTQKGFLEISKEDTRIWCAHYIIENPKLQKEIMTGLEKNFTDVYFHENTWPGLQGILSAMQILFLFQYGLSGVFVLVATLLTGNRILIFERKNTAIFRALGASWIFLQQSFILRFIFVSLWGAITGQILNMLFSDSLISILMKHYGISNFSSRGSLENTIYPIFAVILFFSISAFFVSFSLRKSRLTELMEE